MKIDFTREQYRNLLGYLVIANSVLGPLGDFAEGFEDEAGAGQDLEDYIAQHAPMFDSIDMVHNHDGLLHVDDEVIFQVMGEVMDEYDDLAFWDQLEDRLVLRDLAKMAGEIDDLESVEHQLRKDYAEEFETNGLERVQFKDATENV